MDRDTLMQMLGGMTGGSDNGKNTKVPATREQAIDFMSHDYKPAVGDVVKWRPNCRILKEPEMDQECVVTQVLADPLQEGDHPFDKFDVALLVVHNCGNSECKAEGTLMEVPGASRRLMKVGTILT